MKTCLFIYLTFFSIHSFALEDRHMMSFGTNGLGWSGVAEQIEANSGSDFKRLDFFLNQLALNYAYRLSARTQVGVFIETTHREYFFEKKTGGKSTSELQTNSFGLFVIYNFSDQITDSLFSGLSLSQNNYEEEISHDFADEEGKNPLEFDDIGFTIEIVLGKRFNLSNWKIEHLTYAPQMSFFHRTHGKDLDDQKLGDGFGINFQIIKFDFLF